ncbi:uncharacterized protein LOC121243231 [Juglans microcarpa x Juglans regia]|uniref:uncharacterized protein LOC121243231 n=1 Tax=Juglans microcarpa x Juglans regia TaxID=2249226 RepID=UPI001B7F6429|nr:uncharacterized protein LOC121243231 [Juglans microcarpa x Juglans regia]
MEERSLDYVLVPSGLLLMGVYHVWLFVTILYNPRRTVIGINAECRQAWIFSIMNDPMKNGVLAVQTIRNNIMASTLLATVAITLCSLISVVVSTTLNSPGAASKSAYTSETIFSVKYFSILVCFLVAFLCCMQSVRYLSHVSFMVTAPALKDKKDSIEYVARNLNRGSLLWSLGLRAYYVSFPLFLWIFGPVPMFVCCCIMPFILYFLDTTGCFTLQIQKFMEDVNANDVESVHQSTGTARVEDSLLRSPLLTDKNQVYNANVA